MEIILYGSIGWRHPFGLGQVVDWATEYGWDGVDARGICLDIPQNDARKVNAFGYDMLGPRQIRGSARRELRSKWEAADMKLSGIYCSSPLNLRGPLGNACRELVRDYLRLGADLGVDWIRPINNTTDAVEGPPMSDEEAYQATVDGFRAVAPLANELGIGLLLENNENTTTSDAASLLRMRDDLKDHCRVGIAYDGANAYFQGLDPAEQMEMLAGKFEIMHLKNTKRHEEGRWDYLPRGDYSYEWTTLAGGDLDWHALVGAARQAGFDGQLVYEYVNPFKGMPPAYWDTLPEPADAARNEGEFLRSVLAQTGDR